MMGDLTAQLAEVKKLRKHDEAEYDRTRQAVAGFRLKYLARRTPRNNLALHSQVQLLTAERDERGPPPLIPLASLVSQVISSTSGGTRPRRWAPTPLFADLITPAMLDTGATSEQINKVTSFVPPPPSPSLILFIFLSPALDSLSLRWLTRTCHEHLPISPGATRRTGGGLDADLRYWSPRRERQR